MKATDHIKRAAFEKAVDYFLADPEHNIVKIMDLIDKVAPKDLFASQRAAFRGAIDDQSNWYRLIMHIMNDTNPEVRDDLVKTLIIAGSLKPTAINTNAISPGPSSLILPVLAICTVRAAGQRNMVIN